MILKKNYLSVYAKSFNWAGFFLPKQTYNECSALYNFCRIIDNIADEKDTLLNKKERFTKFKKDFYSKKFSDDIIQDMWNLIDKYKISLNIINDLFDGIETDLDEKVKFITKNELLIYSYRVAGTVGLMMAKILKVNKPKALRAAVDLGIAMQLTNISRDVIEDYNNHRIYIDNNYESINETLNLAEKFYKNSFYSIKEIPLGFRFSILVARRVYKKIGDNILSKKNFQTYKNAGKIYVNNFDKIIQTLICFVDLIKLSLIKNNENLTDNEHLIIAEKINFNERI